MGESKALERLVYLRSQKGEKVFVPIAGARIPQIQLGRKCVFLTDGSVVRESILGVEQRDLEDGPLHPRSPVSVLRFHSARR